MSFSDDIRRLFREKDLNCITLAEMLSLDENTVSKWELGTELPDKSTLSKLRECFPETELPEELYSFKIENAEAKAGFKFNRQRWLIRNIAFCVLFFVIGLVFKYLDIDAVATVGFIMTFIYIAVTLSPLAPLAKQNKKTLERFSRSRFEYCVFRDRVSISTWEGEKRVSEQGYFYSDATLCLRSDKLLLPYFNNSYLIIPLRAIAADSLLFSALEPKTVKKRRNERIKAPVALRIISIVLLVIGIIAIPIGTLIIVGALLEDPLEIGSVMIMVCAVPAISMVFGLIMAILGKREGRKNVFVASAAILVFCIVLTIGTKHIIPSLDTVGPPLEEVMAKSEAALGVDLPEADESELYYYNVEYNDFFVYYYGYIYFDEGEALAIKDASDELWLDHVPSSLKGICEEVEILDYYDSFIFYNMDNGEHNKLPSESGQYRFMVLYLDTEYDEMYIAEYDLDYAE